MQRHAHATSFRMFSLPLDLSAAPGEVSRVWRVAAVQQACMVTSRDMTSHARMPASGFLTSLGTATMPASPSAQGNKHALLHVSVRHAARRWHCACLRQLLVCLSAGKLT
jgi:hypothetical protein